MSDKEHLHNLKGKVHLLAAQSRQSWAWNQFQGPGASSKQAAIVHAPVPRNLTKSAPRSMWCTTAGINFKWGGGGGG